MNAPTLASGTSVGGRWRVQSYIGRGELGEVYAVRDPLSGQTGALKRFSPALLGHTDAWAAFDKAAKAVAALPFDAFAKRIDSGTDAAPWVVTDRVVWPSLADQVRAGGALPVERMAAMLDALAPALDAAHAAGLVHRDLKPGNVFVEPADRPTVHLTDFGVWRLRVALGIPPGWASTPGWLGPDAADPAETSTPRMDVFALGLVVFHALTGHGRFAAAERQPLDIEALWKEMLEPVGAASALASGLGVPLDAALDDWFSQALAPRPEQRFASVGEMAGGLRAAMRSMGSAAKVPARPGPALQRQLGPSTPPPSGTKPAREPPPPSSNPQHEPVAMVSAQPLAYLRVPTRPPPEDPDAPPPPSITPAAAPPTVPAPAAAPPPPSAPAAPAPVAPPPSPFAAALPTAQAAPANEAPPDVPKKGLPIVPLAIGGGVIVVGGLALLVAHVAGSSSAAAVDSAPPARSATAAASASPQPAGSTRAAPSASATAEPAPPKQAMVRFECEPDCDRIECDGREVELDAGSAALDPGPHRCTATRRGYLPKNDRFQLDAGQEATRHLELTKLRPRPQAVPHHKKKPPCGTFINPCK